MFVIVRNIIEGGDRHFADLVEQGPVSARVILTDALGNPTGWPEPNGIWVAERNIDRVARIDEDENGVRTLVFTSGVTMIEGTAAVPGTEE